MRTASGFDHLAEPIMATGGARPIKRLVLCCDGTWNKALGGADSTNVWKLRRALAPTGPDGVEQRPYYHAGVGTARFTRYSGGALGFGLRKNLLHAYEWVVANYQPGDEIFLFGFSRGAYTARSLAGLIRNCGILRPQFAQKAAEALDVYRNRREGADDPAAVEFRANYSTEAAIAFIGVWDTVGALGVSDRVPRPLRPLTRRSWGFHDVRLSGQVEIAVQALALDERRRKYRPNLWERPEGRDDQVLEQVWFAGVHSNIGGGYAQCELSDISLRWMMHRAAAPRSASRVGLAFRPDAMPHEDDYGNLAEPQGLMKLLPTADRSVGRRPERDGLGHTDEPDSTQFLHPSVLRRIQHCGYDPAALRPWREVLLGLEPGTAPIGCADLDVLANTPVPALIGTDAARRAGDLALLDAA